MDLLLYRGRSHVEALSFTWLVPLLRPLVAGFVDFDEAGLPCLLLLLSCEWGMLIDLDLRMRYVELFRELLVAR